MTHGPWFPVELPDRLPAMLDRSEASEDLAPVRIYVYGFTTRRCTFERDGVWHERSRAMVTTAAGFVVGLRRVRFDA